MASASVYASRFLSWVPAGTCFDHGMWCGSIRKITNGAAMKMEVLGKRSENITNLINSLWCLQNMLMLWGPAFLLARLSAVTYHGSFFCVSSLVPQISFRPLGHFTGCGLPTWLGIPRGLWGHYQTSQWLFAFPQKRSVQLLLPATDFGVLFFLPSAFCVEKFCLNNYLSVLFAPPNIIILQPSVSN